LAVSSSHFDQESQRAINPYYVDAGRAASRRRARDPIAIARPGCIAGAESRSKRGTGRPAVVRIACAVGKTSGVEARVRAVMGYHAVLMVA